MKLLNSPRLQTRQNNLAFVTEKAVTFSQAGYSQKRDIFCPRRTGSPPVRRFLILPNRHQEHLIGSGLPLQTIGPPDGIHC